MIRFDNVLFANVLVSSDPNTKSMEFLWIGAGSTLVLRLYFLLQEPFFIGQDAIEKITLQGNELLLLLLLLLQEPFFIGQDAIEKITLQGNELLLLLLLLLQEPFFVCLFFWGGYSNLLLVHLRLKHRGNVFFGEDARKDNSPRVISCYQAKTKVSVFSRKP